MRLLVCGSMLWADYDKVEEVLDRVTAGADKVVLVHGAARGADRMAADVARKRGWVIESHRAEWKRAGRGAGMVRNRRMLLTGRPDCVVAFIDERSRPSKRTRDMIRRSKDAGIRGLIIRARE
jgi:hypothetical protein